LETHPSQGAFGVSRRRRKEGEAIHRKVYLGRNGGDTRAKDRKAVPCVRKRRGEKINPKRLSGFKMHKRSHKKNIIGDKKSKSGREGEERKRTEKSSTRISTNTGQTIRPKGLIKKHKSGGGGGQTGPCRKRRRRKKSKKLVETNGVYSAKKKKQKQRRSLKIEYR